MKLLANYLSLFSAVSMVFCPLYVNAGTASAQKTKQFENVRRMAEVYAKIGQQTTFGRFYDEMKRTIAPKHREFVISKVHQSGVVKSQRIPVVSVHENVIEFRAKGETPVKIEFIGKDGVYAKINGFPVLLEEADNPRLVFQRLQEISAKIKSQNTGLVSWLMSWIVPQAEANMMGMMMMMMMMSMFGGGGSSMMMPLMMMMMLPMMMGGGGNLGIGIGFGSSSAK